MMDFELKLSKPSRRYSCLEGLVMGVSYFVGKRGHHVVQTLDANILPGGLLPMIPYFAVPGNIFTALYISIGVTCVVLLLFGFLRARLIGTSVKDQFLSAGLTLLLGGTAAGVAYGVVWGVNGGLSK